MQLEGIKQYFAKSCLQSLQMQNYSESQLWVPHAQSPIQVYEHRDTHRANKLSVLKLH